MITMGGRRLGAITPRSRSAVLGVVAGLAVTVGLGGLVILGGLVGGVATADAATPVTFVGCGARKGQTLDCPVGVAIERAAIDRESWPGACDGRWRYEKGWRHIELRDGCSALFAVTFDSGETPQAHPLENHDPDDGFFAACTRIGASTPGLFRRSCMTPVGVGFVEAPEVCDVSWEGGVRGYDEDALNSCAADVQAYPVAGGKGSKGLVKARAIHCDSVDGAYRICDPQVDGVRSIEVLHRHSSTTCDGRWHEVGSLVHVYAGCRADFVVLYTGAERAADETHEPGPALKEIPCGAASSTTEAVCQTGVTGIDRVILHEGLQGGPDTCDGNSWRRTGTDGASITVDGCDGLFRVFYTGEDAGTPDPGGCDGARSGIGPDDDGGGVCPEGITFEMVCEANFAIGEVRTCETDVTGVRSVIPVRESPNALSSLCADGDYSIVRNRPDNPRGVAVEVRNCSAVFEVNYHETLKLPFDRGTTWRLYTHGGHDDWDFDFQPAAFRVGRPVVAVASGTATWQCQNLPHSIIVLTTPEHGDFRYLHVDSESARRLFGGRTSMKVSQGQVVGHLSGMVGRPLQSRMVDGVVCDQGSAGAHLHFEILGRNADSPAVVFDEWTFRAGARDGAGAGADVCGLEDDEVYCGLNSVNVASGGLADRCAGVCPDWRIEPFPMVVRAIDHLGAGEESFYFVESWSRAALITGDGDVADCLALAGQTTAQTLPKAHLRWLIRWWDSENGNTSGAEQDGDLDDAEANRCPGNGDGRGTAPGEGPTLADLEGSIVKIVGNERGEPAMVVSDGRLLHIGTADDYWDCVDLFGDDVTLLDDESIEAQGWPVDWSGTTDRCEPGDGGSPPDPGDPGDSDPGDPGAPTGPTIDELHNSIVKIRGNERGEPALLAWDGKLYHIGSADDYWDCFAQGGERVTFVEQAYVDAKGWPIDWSGTTDRCG